jgi:hypothetical protein
MLVAGLREIVMRIEALRLAWRYLVCFYWLNRVSDNSQNMKVAQKFWRGHDVAQLVEALR